MRNIRISCRTDLLHVGIAARLSSSPARALAAWLAILAPLAFPAVASAQVNWLDPLNYTNPRTVAVSEPAESSVANKYWIDLSSGSGSSCTQASPCGSFAAVSGKPGTAGGPAYIYLKGSGSIGSPTLYGAAGSEVVIKPWDDNTPATITGRNNWTTRHQYVIWDGGSNMQIRFVNSGSNQFDPSVYFNATSGLHSNITFYRTQWQVTNAGEWIAQWGVVNNLSFINNEFYATNAADTGNQHHVYLSGASNYGASSGIRFLSNIFRDTPGEAIEVRLYQSLSGLTIDGNVMHNLGKGTCPTSWKCRSAITLAIGSGSPALNTVQISNNLIWDTGEGIVRMWAGNPAVYNNTVYNWGMGSPANGGYGQWAFFGYSNDAAGTLDNNIIYAAGSTANGYAKVAFDRSPFSTASNLCGTGSCGSSQIAATSLSTVLASTDQNSAQFLEPASGSPANSGGTSVALTVDYLGKPRLSSSPGIGAIEYGTATTVPMPPSNVAVQ